MKKGPIMQEIDNLAAFWRRTKGGAPSYVVLSCPRRELLLEEIHQATESARLGLREIPIGSYGGLRIVGLPYVDEGFLQLGMGEPL